MIKEKLQGLNGLNDILDNIKRTLPKDQQQTYEVFNKQIGKLQNTVQIKVNELYHNILNNFNKPTLNNLNITEKKMQTKQNNKENIFELVSKRMILSSNSNFYSPRSGQNKERQEKNYTQKTENKALQNFVKVSKNSFEKVSLPQKSIITTLQIIHGKFVLSFEEICMALNLNLQQSFNLRQTIVDIGKLCNKQPKAIITTTKLKQILNQKPTLNIFENLQELQKPSNQQGIIKMQSLIKMFLQKQKYKNKLKSILLIQSYWRRKQRLVELKKRIKATNEKKLQKFNELQDEFMKKYNKFQNRIEIHVPSWTSDEMKRLSTEKYKQKQNEEITRIFRVKDSYLTVIYVSPIAISTQMKNYYKKVLSFREEQNQRVYFVTPQNQITGHESLITSMLNSPKCLERIKQLTKNKIAYIVPGQPSMQYVSLAIELNVPVYGFSAASQFLSLKSGALSLVEQNQIPCSYNIYEINDLFLEFSRLIYLHPEVERWYLKIDDQKKGRGNAYVQTKSFSEFKKLQEQKSEQYQQSIINYISIILQDKLKQRLKIVYPTLYRSYQQYLKTFLIKGGIIQAGVPTLKEESSLNVSSILQIEPNGNWKVLAVYEKLIVHDKTVGYQFIDMNKTPEIRTISKIIEKLIKQYKFFGYISLDFFRLPQNNFELVGLDSYINSAISSYFMSSYFTGFSNPLFLYCPIIVQNGIKNLDFKTFFQFCRLQGISFDINTHSGSIFILLDSLQSSCISLICISNNKKQVYKYMCDTIEFLLKKSDKKQQKINFLNTYDGISLQQIFHKIKVQHKRIQPKPMSQTKNLVPLR